MMEAKLAARALADPKFEQGMGEKLKWLREERKHWRLHK